MASSGGGRIGLDVRLTYYVGGGIARYVQNLAERLPALDPEREHVHFYRRGHAARFSAAARRVDCWTPAHHWLEPLALSAEVSRWRPDLLHSPDFIPPLWGYRRSVITVHDLAFLRFPEHLTSDSRRYYNAQIRRAVRWADHISADSQATRDDLLELLGVPASKVTVIHLGVDPAFRVLEPEEFQPALERYRLPRGYVLFVGTFEPRKNVPGLLAAYHRLRQQLPEAPPLVLVGHRGWLFDQTAAVLQALRLEPHVRFLESVPAADLPALYNGASVFVLLSHYEGFGFPLLEALACGVPAVISNLASLPELAAEAALQTGPQDAEAAAEALRRALTEEALRGRLRTLGLERARHFSWDRTAGETLRLYRQVLDNA